MNVHEILQQFITGMRHTTLPEYVAVIFGIASVWYSKKENVLVYPTGLINTVVYTWLSVKAHLLGEASVNVYYTAMSIYGWVLWTRKDPVLQRVLPVTVSTLPQWRGQLLFFSAFYAAIFISLSVLKKQFAPGAIPWADALASATAFTGMWLMAKKKVESWYWWIVTDMCSIPLYFVKGYVFTSVYYIVLLVLAFWGLAEWKKKAGALR